MPEPLSTPRRTQAQRRASTRTALLDAALACLIEEGYAAMTTRNVADRAGVSQGTQMHYFPTRARFVAEAVHHVAVKLATELREREALRSRAERRRLEELLDNVWEIHRGPLFQAAMELWVAARTDREMQDAIGEVTRDVTRMIARGAAEMLPETMSKPRAGELLDMCLATIRGLAVLSFVTDAGEIERRWRRARSHLLGLYDRL